MHTRFFNRPQTIAACEGRGDPARYFMTPLELGRLDSSKWSDMSIKRRDPVSLVASKRCSKAELVTDSNSAMPVTTTWGFNFFINSTIKSDWRGASITVITSSDFLQASAVCKEPNTWKVNRRAQQEILNPTGTKLLCFPLAKVSRTQYAIKGKIANSKNCQPYLSANTSLFT